jgi:hypothetical protein
MKTILFGANAIAQHFTAVGLSLLLSSPALAQINLGKPARYSIMRLSKEPYDSLHQRCATVAGAASTTAAVNDSELSVAQNPNKPLELAAVWRTPYTVQFSSSSDGGFNWSNPRTVPLNGCAGGPSIDDALSQPKLAFDADGSVVMAAILTSPERTVTAQDEEGNFFQSTDPESAAIVATRLNLSGAAITPAYLLDFDSTVASSATGPITISHLTLAPQPRKLNSFLIIATRPNQEIDGFGVRVATAPLRATMSAPTTGSAIARFGALANFAALRSRDQFSYAVPNLHFDAPRSQWILSSIVRDLNPVIANPLASGVRDTLVWIAISEDGTRVLNNRTLTTLTALKPTLQTTVGSAGLPVDAGTDAIATAVNDSFERIAVVYADARAAGGDNLAISMVLSTDGGANFSAPIAVEGRKGQAFWRPSAVFDSSQTLAILASRGRGSSTQPAAGFRSETYLLRLQTRNAQAVRESSELIDLYTYKVDAQGSPFKAGASFPLIALGNRCVLPFAQRYLDQAAPASQQIDLAYALFAASSTSCL